MRKKQRKLDRKGDCRVFWGTHGCSKQRGHVGRHFCEVGCPFPDDYELYGEDVELYVNEGYGIINERRNDAERSTGVAGREGK